MGWLLGCAVAARASFLPPVLVDAHPASVHWATVFTNAVLLRWDWPENAADAVLEIDGMAEESKSVTFQRGESEFLWALFDGTTPTTEDVYELRMTFRTDGSEVCAVQTARLAVVHGAFGPVRIDANTSDKAWVALKQDVVVPYAPGDVGAADSAADSAQLVISKLGGSVQTNRLDDAVGYYGWKLTGSAWGYGTFDVELSFPETPLDMRTARLTRWPEGMMIVVR